MVKMVGKDFKIIKQHYVHGNIAIICEFEGFEWDIFITKGKEEGSPSIRATGYCIKNQVGREPYRLGVIQKARQWYDIYKKRFYID